MGNPLVSVCMITYNHEPYIKEAIEGVLNQKCSFQIELVIGEDCSTDNTRLICENYSKTNPIIKLLPSNKNLGIMPNFTRTLEACNGKYIAFCEGDDYWTNPNKLQKQIDFLEAHPEYSLCFHDYYEKKADRLSKRIINYPDSFNINEYARSLSGIQTLTVVCRNELNPIIPPSYVNKITGSYFIFLRLAEIGSFKYIKEAMATYRIHPGGVYSGKDIFTQGNMSLSNKQHMAQYMRTRSTSVYKIIKRTYVKNALYLTLYFFMRLSLKNMIHFGNLSFILGFSSLHLYYPFYYIYTKVKMR
ncbi:glycosyltransferase family 2 protein [Sunxiuqinia elliptica]|uniref:Glycosyltransferase involved in cell wall biosynthesis n=1 Tax=Sunxiuqinia elliptica TaxID=655355 RepID=A0A4R6GS77_9BACT|nr:glycosyltransferase [Sunxiuqinia elliptica]TDN98219.1 glycosyltransferase involved in cell wall biosynthesis [Sunxiuqinia elliptica]TDO60326.1 glycosyltransferase involved in cell wall biosynthesis [Sunxiuqinia elliptica]